MRISDWSADVCSSDLQETEKTPNGKDEACGQISEGCWVPGWVPAWRWLSASALRARHRPRSHRRTPSSSPCTNGPATSYPPISRARARENVSYGTRVSVRVDTGVRRISQKKKTHKQD